VLSFGAELARPYSRSWLRATSKKKALRSLCGRRATQTPTRAPAATRY